MLLKLALCCLVVTFIASNITASKRPDKYINLITRLLSNKSRKPLVVLLDVEHRHTRSNIKKHSYNRVVKNEDESDILDQEDKEEEAYRLYHLLRTSPDQPANSNEERLKEKSEQYLRSALRSRCQKLNICITLCPKKKPSCPKKCQDVFDELEMCEPEPPKCKRPKCGRTMPPSWLL